MDLHVCVPTHFEFFLLSDNCSAEYIESARAYISVKGNRAQIQQNVEVSSQTYFIPNQRGEPDLRSGQKTLMQYINTRLIASYHSAIPRECKPSAINSVKGLSSAIFVDIYNIIFPQPLKNIRTNKRMYYYHCRLFIDTKFIPTDLTNTYGMCAVWVLRKFTVSH